MVHNIIPIGYYVQQALESQYQCSGIHPYRTEVVCVGRGKIMPSSPVYHVFRTPVCSEPVHVHSNTYRLLYVQYFQLVYRWQIWQSVGIQVYSHRLHTNALLPQACMRLVVRPHEATLILPSPCDHSHMVNAWTGALRKSFTKGHATCDAYFIAYCSPIKIVSVGGLIWTRTLI